MDVDYHSVRDMRTHLDRVLDRARSEPEFAHRLDDDPQGVLIEAGLPSEAVSEISTEIDQARSGHHTLRPHRFCDYTTCWITICNKIQTWATMFPGS